jgi:hypothetical protein
VLAVEVGAAFVLIGWWRALRSDLCDTVGMGGGTPRRTSRPPTGQPQSLLAVQPRRVARRGASPGSRGVARCGAAYRRKTTRRRDPENQRFWDGRTANSGHCLGFANGPSVPLCGDPRTCGRRSLRSCRTREGMISGSPMGRGPRVPMTSGQS